MVPLCTQAHSFLINKVLQSKSVSLIINLTKVFSSEWSQTTSVQKPLSPDLSPSPTPAAFQQQDKYGASIPESPSDLRMKYQILDTTDRQDDRHVKGSHSVDDHGRTVIQVKDIDFVTMHNLLYFLYTARANLHFGIAHARVPTGYPDKADAFELYRVADMYMVQSLTDRCFRFLTLTMTPDNICERLFNVLSQPYKELREEYIAFLLKNYGKVKETQSWKVIFLETEDLTLEERKYRAEALLEITGRLTFAG